MCGGCVFRTDAGTTIEVTRGRGATCLVQMPWYLGDVDSAIIQGYYTTAARAVLALVETP